MKTNDDKKLKESIENFILKELELPIQLRSAGKIGENVCVLEAENMADKINILKNKSKLKQCKDRIFINNDLTEKE
ncbi:unnamed protein product [Diabrotica balteata]|uniref:Uncharacterized protein n=1 Tax=Diabrotica balteata TaxID=107213 RepID=A0A9N9SVR4_DIABA|nr:unnamed protein product [Diabrotica balteata]